MNNLIDKIDAYLDGTMSAEDKAHFESQLANDESLRQQVDAQKNLRAGIDRIGMKAATTSAFRKITLKNKIYKWGMATVVAGAVVAGSYMLMNQSSSEGENITYTLPATNEDGGTEWADADRNLPTQLFTINPTRDTVIETMNGLIFAIPAGAFLYTYEPITVEIREAVTPFDIMKAGLSTTSNGELLETGGMFYINARSGDHSLTMNPEKPICANVPTNEIRPGMQLFEGERKPDGSINWINPKPFEKQLVPVDIFSLNFYPKGFLEKVAELGFDANNRKVTDSIYYSYAGRTQEITGEETSSDSAKVRHILIAYNGAQNAEPRITRSKEQARAKADSLQKAIMRGAQMVSIVEQFTDDPGSKGGNKGDYGWFTRESGFVEPFKNAGFNNNIGDVVVVETDFGFHVIQVLDKTAPTVKPEYGFSEGPDGAALFKANCASCHTTTDQASTGPGLKGVLGRIPGGDWKYDFVHNPAGMIKAGDPYANSLYPAKYKTIMTAFPQLKNEEIDAMLAYADHGGKPYGMEIDPARIAAICTEEFQNTIIATKEFELRLQIAFARCEPGIIDMYVNNLDKKMYEIDSMIAAKQWSDRSVSGDFRYLAERRDGGVAISQSHMKKLQAYYQKKQEAVRIASEKTYNSRTAEQRKQDSIYLNGQSEYFQQGAIQSGNNIAKEFDLNLKEAYRQLEIPFTKAPAPEYYSVEVPTTGWWNVDAYVLQATATRTTLDYTDPNSGKKAVIKYEELKINIADEANYSQLMVYLLGDQLPCFQKVYTSPDGYKINLNELMEYSLVVIGEKDGTWFSAITPKVTPGTVNVTLKGTDEQTLRSTLSFTFGNKVGADFASEMSYMKETHQYNVRKEKEAKQAEIDRQIMEVIFPCVHWSSLSVKKDPMLYGQ